MNCDPNSLIEASKCFRCIPSGHHGAIQTYLLCQWANNLTPPVEQPFVIWEPQTEIATWTDGGGAGQVGDYATFLATADLTTLSDLNLAGTAITDLIANDCPALATIDCNTCTGPLTTLDITGCTALTNLNCSVNGSLTAIAGIGTCTALQTLDSNSCDITGTLGLSGLANLTVLSCYNNANLTSLHVTGCTSLNQLDAFGCNINPTLDLTGLASLSMLNSTGNPNLNSVILTGCVSVSQFRSSACNLGSLDVSVSPLMSYLDCADNINLSSLNVGGSINYTNLYAYGCALPDTPNGVNEALINLETNCLGNAGDADFNTPVTNAAPTGGGAVAKANLIVNGWAVLTN